MLIANASRLTEIVCHSPNLINTDLSECTKLQRIDLSDCTALGTGIGAQPILNIQNCKYLRYCNCMNTQLTAIYTMQQGGNLEEIYYPESTQVVQLTNQTYLHTVGIPYGYDDILARGERSIDSASGNAVLVFYPDYEVEYTFKAGWNCGNFYLHEYDKNGKYLNRVIKQLLSYNATRFTYTPTTDTVDYVRMEMPITWETIKSKGVRFSITSELNTFKQCKNLANVQISNCNAIQYLQYPFIVGDPINFDSLKYVQNLTIINSLSGLKSMQFNGFDKLRNVTLSSLKELESIGFEDMLPVTTTSTLKNITISDCPLITSLSFNVSSDDYQVAFATNGKLDLGGMQSLKTIECNTSVKGLNTLIVPTSLKELKFYPDFGDGLNEIKNIWSASAVHNDDEFEGIDFQDMVIEYVDMLGLNAISNAINFHIAPKDQNPNLNTARDGSTDKPWFHPIGSMDLSNYTGSMIGMLRGVDLNKLDVVISTDRDQVDLTSLFECATIPTAQNIVAKTNNILNKFPNSLIWNYMFKGCDLAFSPNDITIPNRGLSLKGMYKDSNVTEDVNLPSALMTVEEMFMNCTGITSYNDNWLKTYSTLSYTVPTSNGTGGYWTDTGEYVDSTSYNQYLYTPSTDEKAFKIMTNGIGEIRINYFYNNSFLSRKVYTPEYDSYPYVVLIPTDCNKIIFSCDTNVSFLSTGNVSTTNCYTNTGGDLDEIPTAWGGYGFDKSVTSIYVIDTTLLSNTMTFNLVDADSQVGITNWGDGTVNTEKSHTYREHGIYTIKTKSCPNGVAPHDDVKNALIEVKQIKLIGHNGNTQSYSNLFNGCKNLRKVTAYNLVPSDCEYMFYNCSSLTEIVGLNTWNMSNCSKPAYMFEGCILLSNIEGINTWDTSKFGGLFRMFFGCKALTDISFINEWDLFNVRLAGFAFNNCNGLTGEVTLQLDMPKCTSLNSFLGSTNITTLNVTGCNIPLVTDLASFVGSCTNLTSLIGTETLNMGSNLNNLATFAYRTKLTSLNLSTWDFTNVTNIGNFLTNTLVDFNAPMNISRSIDFSNYTNLSVESLLSIISNLAYVSEVQTLTLGTTNIAKLTHKQMVTALVKKWNIPGATIKGVYKDTDISALTSDDTVTAVVIELTADNYLTRIDEVLGVYTNAVDIYFFDDGSVTTLNDMCYNNNTVTKDRIQNVTFLDGYFENCISLGNTFANAKGLVTVTGIPNNVTSTIYTFRNCTLLTIVDAIPSKCKNFFGTFENCKKLISVPENGYTGDMGSTFRGCFSLNQQINIVNPTSLLRTFNDCAELSISPIFTGSYTGTIDYLFSGCKKLTNITLPTTWRPSSANSTFSGCTKLVTIENLDALDMSNCSSINSMFAGCSSLTDLSSISNWNTGKVTTILDLCNKCTSLESIDFIKSWNLSNVGNASSTFAECSGLTGEIALQLNLPKCTTVQSFFLKCTGITSLDVTGWNIPLVTLVNMFTGDCSNLETLIGIETWNMGSNLAGMNYLCTGTKITELNFSNWNFTNVGTATTNSLPNTITLVTLNNIIDNTTNKASNNGLRGLLNSGHTQPFTIVMDEFAMTDFSNLFQGVTKIKNDIVFPNNAVSTTNCFNGCTGITHIHSNWNTSYDINSKDNITRTEDYTNHYYNDDGNMVNVGSNDWKRSTISLNKSFSLLNIKISSADTVRCSYFNGNTFISTYTIETTESNENHIISIPDNCNKIICVSHYAWVYVTMDSTDCYAGCTGITHLDDVALTLNEYSTCLDEIPRAWGGYEFTEKTTGIYVFNVPSDNYTVTVTPSGSYSFLTYLPGTIDTNNWIYVSGYINWGDGNITYHSRDINSNITHTYTTAGTYTVKGQFIPGGMGGGGGSNNPNDYCAYNLLEIKQLPTNSLRGKILIAHCKAIKKVTAYNYKPKSCEYMFTNCPALTEIIGMETWDMSSCTTCASMFESSTALTKVTAYNFKPNKCNSMFKSCSSLTEIVGIETWDMSKCTSYSEFLKGCSSITYDTLLQLSNVLDFSGCRDSGGVASMFEGVTFDNAVPIQQLNVSAKTNFDGMLTGVKVKGDLDLSMWNVHPTNLTSFLNSAIINGSVNLSNWDVSSCTSFRRMLHWSNTPSVNLSGWDFSGCTDMDYYTFIGCSASDWDFTGASGIKFNIVMNNPQNHSVDSLVGLFNALYDFASEGNTDTHTIELGSINLAKLSDEQIAIATNKGWTVS